MPSVQLKFVGLSFSHALVVPPTRLKLLICCVTPFLWSKVFCEPLPQCVQSAVPSVVRFTAEGMGGAAKLPPSVPAPTTETLTVADVVVRPPLSVAFAVSA